MSATDRSLLLPAAVYVGAVILVGLPARTLVASGFRVAIEAIVWGVRSNPVATCSSLLSHS